MIAWMHARRPLRGENSRFQNDVVVSMWLAVELTSDEMLGKS